MNMPADMPADQYELYAVFGMAAEKAQVVEVGAGNVVLSFLLLFRGTDNISAEETEMFRSLIDDLNRKTFGRLLTSIKRIGNFDETILRAVDDALERRNYLMHHFFRTHNFAIFDAAGRQAMLGELREIYNKLAVAEAMLNVVSECLDRLAGREGVSEKVAEQFRARRRRVKI